jgi:phosphate transport system substrate-binding protein
LTIKYKKLWIALTLLTVAAIALTGCGSSQEPTGTDGDEISGSFNIIGSNTVTPLTAVWAEDFMNNYPAVNIAVSGPGSGAGIAALINKTTDICQASRTIKDSEIEQARAAGVEPNEIQVATDALSVIVHPDNPVTELTTAQLSAIYTGQITNWQEVGGNEAEIVAIARDTNSGTHVYFKEKVVQMEGLDTEDTSLEYGGDVLMLPSTEEGVNQVADNTNAIFYPGLGYVTGEVKALGIKTTAEDEAIWPSLETALDGTYPIARPLLYYTNGTPDGVIKAFIDYCLSAEGQARVTEVGYVPLP